MKTKFVNNMNTEKKRKYNRPDVTVIKIDNEISVFMASPGDDPPETSFNPDHFSLNPFKLPKL
jgi:hypothetical protein